mmetsp:Transcript_64949/g.115578  ORF Transcript_64949/g.115578 Transcript_64949/m.115578 type:complete len:166 (-) Transcript_64949:490-987(-)
MILNASTVELSDVQKYTVEKCGDRPVILWNLELDTLRSDLGLPGFPGKSLHYNWLTQFLAVFYLRKREYSKTIPTPPYTFDYEGALFREWPAPWQVMLKTQDKALACVAERRTKYPLGQVKQELLIALGQAEEVGSGMEFARTGYKTETWFEEEDAPEASRAWRM